MLRRDASRRLHLDSAPWFLALGPGLLVLLGFTAGLGVTVAVIGLSIEALFIVYFFRHLSFAAAALRHVPSDLTDVGSGLEWCPPVTVLVACRNEEAVVEALVRHLTKLEYPEHSLQLVVVDDGSSDATGAILDRLSETETRLTCVHRPPGATGGKSGALNEALAFAHGDILVVFDADHRPRPDVLLRLVRHFIDPTVGAAQGRCVIYNDADSPLTQLVAIEYLGGYLVNEYGRQAMHALPAYGGANCAVRASSLRELGGWNEDSVTEDTDLTLRLLLRGEHVRYDVTAVDLEEGAVTLSQYWRQRYRWARGHQQVWRTYRRAVWRSRHLTFGEKVELTLFLFGFHLPALSLLGLAVSLLWLFGAAPNPVPDDLFVLWMLLFVGPLLECGAGLLLSGRERRLVWSIAFLLPLFVTSMVLCAKAWVDGVLGRPYRWVKTRRAQELLEPIPTGPPS
jgi:cellulose synthase/poly-beta-1,6-N-acetylglucosamine synthase-like glycosyltransferase